MCKEVREVSAKEGPDGEEHNSSKATTLAHKTLIFFCASLQTHWRSNAVTLE